MTQLYDPLEGSDLFADSYGKINGTDDAVASCFAGATEPTAPIAYQFWADTTTGLLKQRNAANNAWIALMVLGSANGGLLLRSGGTMTGAINMGGFAITNLAAGTGAAAARQQDLDLKAPIAAPALTGDAQINQDPTGNNSITRRSWTEGRYLKKAGDTMTGTLTLAAPAAASLQPTSLLQVQDLTSFNTTSGHRHDGTNSRKVLATSLDAAGSSSGQFLKSTGAGTAPAWASSVGDVVVVDAPALCINVDTANGTFGTTYLTVDLSASAPTGAFAATLRVNITANAFTYVPTLLRFRQNGSAHDGAGLSVGIFDLDDTKDIVVGLDATKKFQWKATGALMGKGVLTAYVVGWFVP